MAETTDYMVYKHTTPNGKVYIGITCKSTAQRWKNGKGYIKNSYFWKAIQKYGWDYIKHEILFTGLTKEEAETKEIELIAEHKSNQREYGYNISSGGESGNAGVKASNETRQKMSQKRAGECNAFFGRKHTDQTKKKISIANKGNPAWNKGERGKTPSEKTRKRMSEAHKGARNHFFGKTHSPETRKKLSDIGKTLVGGKNPKARRVCQKTTDGELLKVWDCVKNASAYLGVSYSYLIHIMKSQKPYKGFLWTYEGVR